MQIGAGIESANESLVAGELGQNAQFDLRIISNHQFSAFGMAPKTATVFDGVRHLLNIRVSTSEAARGRPNLAKICMQPIRLWIDEFDHVPTIAGQRLLHRAVFEEL